MMVQPGVGTQVSLQLLIFLLKGQFMCDDLGRTRMKVCAKEHLVLLN